MKTRTTNGGTRRMRRSSMHDSGLLRGWGYVRHLSVVKRRERWMRAAAVAVLAAILLLIVASTCTVGVHIRIQSEEADRGTDG